MPHKVIAVPSYCGSTRVRCLCPKCYPTSIAAKVESVLKGELVLAETDSRRRAIEAFKHPTPQDRRDAAYVNKRLKLINRINNKRAEIEQLEIKLAQLQDAKFSKTTNKGNK